MSINLIVGGSITKTSRGKTTYEVLDGSFNSYAGKQNIWQAEGGTNYHIYTPPEKKPVNEDKDFPFGWWSTDPEGNIRLEYDDKLSVGFRAQLEDTVYFQLRVNKRVPIGTQIKFKLWDHDSSYLRYLIIPAIYVIYNDDDDDFGVEGEELFKTSTVEEM